MDARAAPTRTATPSRMPAKAPGTRGTPPKKIGGPKIPGQSRSGKGDPGKSVRRSIRKKGTQKLVAGSNLFTHRERFPPVPPPWGLASAMRAIESRPTPSGKASRAGWHMTCGAREPAKWLECLIMFALPTTCARVHALERERTMVGRKAKGTVRLERYLTLYIVSYLGQSWI